MTTKCEKCKTRNAHLILDIVEDDPGHEDDMFDENYEGDGLVDRSMKVCRPCAKEVQRAMRGGVTMVRKISKKGG